MRLIEERMLAAIRYNNEKLKLGNTEVRDGCVYLHGNMIYRRIDHNTAMISFSGWKTRTTSSRLQAIMRRMGYKHAVDGLMGVSSSEKNPMDPHSWYLIYR